MDALCRLKGYPYILDEILANINQKSLSEAEKASLAWKEIVQNHYMTFWKRKVRISPTWKMLAARAEHIHPFNQTERGDASYFAKVLKSAKESIKEMDTVKLVHSYNYWRNLFEREGMFAVNEKYVFFSCWGNVIIINRWTRELVKELEVSDEDHVTGLQLNGSLLAVSLYNGSIIIYDHQTLQQIQVMDDQIESGIPAAFRLGCDKLVTTWEREDDRSLIIILRRLNSLTGLFDKKEVTRLPSNFEICFSDVYFDDKFLIVELYDEGMYNRVIVVFDTDTMKKIQQKTFQHCSDIRIKRECHNGIIIVMVAEPDYELETIHLEAWDIVKNTLKRITKSSLTYIRYAIQNSTEFDVSFVDYVYSGAVDSNPNYQFLVSKSRDDGQWYLEVDFVGGRRHEEEPFPLKRISTFLPTFINLVDQRRFYFDGLQCIYQIENKIIFLDFL